MTHITLGSIDALSGKNDPDKQSKLVGRTIFSTVQQKFIFFVCRDQKRLVASSQSTKVDGIYHLVESKSLSGQFEQYVKPANKLMRQHHMMKQFYCYSWSSESKN